MVVEERTIIPQNQCMHAIWWLIEWSVVHASYHDHQYPDWPKWQHAFRPWYLFFVVLLMYRPLVMITTTNTNRTLQPGLGR